MCDCCRIRAALLFTAICVDVVEQIFCLLEISAMCETRNILEVVTEKLSLGLNVYQGITL